MFFMLELHHEAQHVAARLCNWGAGEEPVSCLPSWTAGLLDDDQPACCKHTEKAMFFPHQKGLVLREKRQASSAHLIRQAGKLMISFWK